MVDAARRKSVRRLDTKGVIAMGVVDSNDTEAWEGQPGSKRGQMSVQSHPKTNGHEYIHRIFQVEPPPTTCSAWEKEGEEQNDAMSEESLALLKAQAAIDGLTRGDICELRSFAKPPAAVKMATAALMVVLTGQGEPTAEGWAYARRYMTDVDRLFAAIAGLDLDTLTTHKMRTLEAYAQNPAFRPDKIACVSLPASKLCSWILGVLVSGSCRPLVSGSSGVTIRANTTKKYHVNS